MSYATQPSTASQPSAHPQPHRKKRSARSRFLWWLRQIHLWLGLWGAALGLIFGATGILMNHRAILKIPIEKVKQSHAQLTLPEGGFKNIEQLQNWLSNQTGYPVLQNRNKIDPAKTVIWGEQEVRQPECWSVNLQNPQHMINAEYFVGNQFVKVEYQDANLIGTLTRLHMATGVNTFWVLLSDTIAGSLILLSLSGLLLWSQLHGVKLLSLLISLCALGGMLTYLL